VVWRNSPQTRVNALRDSLSMIGDLLRIRLNDVCGRYDLCGSVPPGFHQSEIKPLQWSESEF
jgi:hypothetical protein